MNKRAVLNDVPTPGLNEVEHGSMSASLNHKASPVIWTTSYFRVVPTDKESLPLNVKLPAT